MDLIRGINITTKYKIHMIKMTAYNIVTIFRYYFE